MGAILSSLRNTVIVGILVMLAVVFGLNKDMAGDANTIARYLHVISGVMWIGLLWYFNFVQIPTMPKIPDELKPAVGKHIAPEALFWFRWGAMATLATGLAITMAQPGYFAGAFTLQEGYRIIGVGMYMAIIMWFNVWFVIWPNQKKALGIVEADADTKAAAARTAMLFSRTNTLLSIPMLYCMVAQS